MNRNEKAMSREGKFSCNDLEEALREDSPEQIAALELHAQTCPACQTELVLWRQISAAATTMHKEWPSPALWPRIAESLAADHRPQSHWRARVRQWFAAFATPSLRWQVALAVLAVALISGTAAWVMTHRYSVSTPDNQHLLTEQAVQQVEQAQRNYEQSIQQLEKLTGPKLADDSSPLMESYREKIEMLDEAIADCRANLEKNQANAYLRRQLLEFYQEKQKTLQEVLRGDGA
jgi:hypothetical protein